MLGSAGAWLYRDLVASHCDDVHRRARPPARQPARLFLLLLVGLSSSAAVVGSAGCASMPDERAERALYLDVRRIVSAEQRTGWVIDRHELEDVAPLAMRSICQAAPVVRRRVLSWLDQRIAAGGGSAQELWEASGRERTGAVDELLLLERTRMTLAAGDGNSEADCPFWLPLDPDFSGVQSSAYRFTVMLESRGGLFGLVREGEVEFGGGGGGRVLGAYGVNHRLSLALGVELAGGAFPRETSDGVALSTTFGSALPVLARTHLDGFMIDVEVAPVIWFTTRSATFPPGLRGSVAFGLPGLRTGALLPYAMLWLGYEYHPPRGSQPLVHVFGIGTRIGLDIDP